MKLASAMLKTGQQLFMFLQLIKVFCMSSRGNLKKEKRLRGLLGWGESTFAELSMRTTCWVFAKVRYPYLRLIVDFSSNTWYIICEDQGF